MNSTCSCYDTYINAIIQLSGSQLVVLVILFMQIILIFLTGLQSWCIKISDRDNRVFLSKMFRMRNEV